ncbi:MAG: PQQ-binding-like beta-propeller repeat protein [Gemmataceae bacterium]|nr:PQQ-binding-like beta-propeller repeat protein [Gemmataceae bacterium]
MFQRALLILVVAVSIVVLPKTAGRAGDEAALAKRQLDKLGVQRGLCMLLGDKAELAVPLARQTELTIFVQAPDAKQVETLRRQADAAGLLGTRVYIHHDNYKRLHLADNLVDAILLDDKTAGPGGVARAELQRVLRPDGRILAGGVVATKAAPEDTDTWTHPYHAPDNNPQSNDLTARRPFLTHFLAEPWYCPLTQMTVVSGGRMFKAFGDRSSARPQEDMLNKLIAMSAYNGTILWKRDLSPGFMIHRNTLIATPDTLYLGDDASCKLIDAATGKVRDEIVVPAKLSDGPTWKWMALAGESRGERILYALVGEKEAPEVTLRGERIRGAGWPWWKYNNYKYGFGRTLLAIDPATKKILWHHRQEEPIDGRAVCLKNGRLYFYSDQKFLACLDAASGKLLWKNSDKKLLDAIGVPGSAQHPMLGFASTAYMKAGDDALYFAGPQRPRIVAASIQDGKLLWKHDGGNVQLVLRKEGLYALGEGRINEKPSSLKLDPVSGKVLATFPSRDRCTRATGCADSIFTRGGAGGSTAVFDLTSADPKMNTLTPMRPACTDGVVVAHGHLFWGPWMCACDQTQIGVISLAHAGGFDYQQQGSDAERLQTVSDADLHMLATTAADWPTYRKDNARTVATQHEIPAAVARQWEYQPPHRIIATAPTAAGGLIFVSGADGIVRALDAGTGKPRWSSYTGGPVKYPPTVWNHRLYVGSGDGWVYCLEAATGKTRWRFRAAPQERIMPVYGALSSTWPVGSGVLVDSGVAYAAAGIFNYDGTHVYALDAETGKIRWQNNTSGALPADAKGEGAGVSVQGHLLLHNKSIYMPAGNKPTIASYAVADGKFAAAGQGRGKHLYVRNGQVRGTGFPLYWRPDDDHFLTPLELETPAGILDVATARIAKHNGDAKKPVWAVDKPFGEIAAVAVGKNAAIVAGVNRDKKGAVTASGLCAIDLHNGAILWREALPAPPVAWGAALDRDGRIVVTMTDGRVAAYR